MRKLYSLFVAVLFLSWAGTAFGYNCGMGIEPKEGGPVTCIESVYNNSGGTLDAGDVVIWDMEQSTGDNDNWVTTTTTADTYHVAGVVLDDITAGTSGTIVTRGFVAVDVAGGLNVVDGLACTSVIAGSARTCITNDANFGFVVTILSAGSANLCVNCNK